MSQSPAERSIKQRLYSARYRGTPKGRFATNNATLKSKYGIDYAARDAILIAQGYCCAICGKLPTTKKVWHTDHNHRTGKVRGVLCHHCNSLLGYALDNQKILWQAILYLEKHR